MTLPSPALRDQPSRLFVETTSRCNLSCAMCMKQSGAGDYRDGDLSAATFRALEPVMPGLEALILNGVGEPLLSPQLERHISRARELMPRQGWIGFQSNGLLLTTLRAISLTNAGLDRICFSLDGVTPETVNTVRGDEALCGIDHALGAMNKAKMLCNRTDLRVGVEFVVTEDNLRELPAALRWASERNASFAIVSHLLPYDEHHREQCSYDLCSGEALALFHVWKDKAQVARVDISRYFKLLWKFVRTPEEQRIIDFVSAMKADAARHGVTLDLKRLIAFDYDRSGALHEAFEEAREVAALTGMELRLPEIAPAERKNCDFISSGGAFVSWDGGVHPCYYLWHQCRAYAGGWHHPVQPKLFGSLEQESLLEIWNRKDFRAYRQNVLSEDYPYCPGCPSAPCDYVQSEPFTRDCYQNMEPCGACLWSSGLFHCLS